MKTATNIPKNATARTGHVPFLVATADTCADCTAPATTTRTSIEDETFRVCGDCNQLRENIIRSNAAPAEALTALMLAKTAIAEAQRLRLAGLITNPHDFAEQLHEAIDDAQAEHLARPDVGGFSADEARGHEAFSTAWEAMRRTLDLSKDPAGTARSLRTVLDRLASEAGVRS
ncbi:hypothetical protein ACFWBR_35020 [Streptomyces sp. NPDC060006]|uniref:hypothetical protein n=1 Tax=unclassified Streptomyces TaxID=2593676 RepID=UPI003695D462